LLHFYYLPVVRLEIAPSSRGAPPHTTEETKGTKEKIDKRRENTRHREKKRQRGRK
jgi:hypothetical protein